jgi:hypothetical protein
MLLIPPKDTRYLYPINDYDILEFRTPVNPWKVQPEYQDDFDKIKTLEVELFQGMVMFVPAYWWYSIQFIVSETSVCSFKYRTHMNTISIAPQLILNVLQNMNIKRDTLENRAYIKNQFQNSTITSNTNSENGNALQQNASSSSSSSHYQSGTEYVPSLEDQYLPKTLRGTSSNPYSIMNAMSENVATTESNPPLTIEPSSSSPLEVSTVPETIKEVIVTPNLVSSQESSSVIS